MSPEMEALKGNKGVVASVIAAAIGFTVFCLVGVAVLLGWIGPGVRPMRAPANDLGLSPGETLVTADARPAAKAAAPTPTPAPATAPVAAPAPPVAAKPPPVSAPAVPSRPAHEPKRSRKTERATTARATADFAERREPQERRKEAPPATESPSPPVAAAAPHPSDPTDHWPQPNCGNCGVVHSITTFPDLWEVRIRFDDGGRRTIRYHKPPRWRVGDRIRYDGGRLERE